MQLEFPFMYKYLTSQTRGQTNTKQDRVLESIENKKKQ
jgi:hypothetical protein